MTLSKIYNAYSISHSFIVQKIANPIDRVFSHDAQRALIHSAIALTLLAAMYEYLPIEFYLISAIMPVQGLALGVVTKVISHLVNYDTNRKDFNDIVESTSPFILSVAAPLCEEFEFRVILQGCLNRLFPPIASIFVASSVFGSIHYYSSSKGNLPHAIASGWQGIVFGTLYSNWGFAAAFFAHSLNNCVMDGMIQLAKKTSRVVAEPTHG